MFKHTTIIVLVFILLSAPCYAQTQSDSASHESVTYGLVLRTLGLDANTYFPFILAHDASCVLDCDFIQIRSTSEDGFGLRLRFERHSDLWQGGESPGYAYASGASAFLRYSRSGSSSRGDFLFGATSVSRTISAFKGKSAIVIALDVRQKVIPVVNVHVQLAAFYGRDPVKAKWILSLPGFLIGIGIGYFI